MKTLGEKIKEARIKKGLKQSELAKILDVGASTISNWETDVNKPDVEMLEYICGALEVPPRFFFTSAPAQAVSEDDIKIALFGGDGEVTDEMWEEAVLMAEIIKEKYRRKEKKGE